jgi:hypothetical protein
MFLPFMGSHGGGVVKNHGSEESQNSKETEYIEKEWSHFNNVDLGKARSREETKSRKKQKAGGINVQ